MQASVTRPPERPQEPVTRVAEPQPGARKRRSTLGRRRRFLIHSASQLRTALLVTTPASVVVLLLNFAMHQVRLTATAAATRDSPQLMQVLASQNRFEMILTLLASLIFLAGLFAVSILESHKTVGAAHSIAAGLQRVSDGEYGTQLTLRRGDNLRNLEAAFNEMSRTLSERGAIDVQELDHIASVAARVGSPVEAGDLARSLREMADEKRRLLVNDASD